MPIITVIGTDDSSEMTWSIFLFVIVARRWRRWFIIFLLLGLLCATFYLLLGQWTWKVGEWLWELIIAKETVQQRLYQWVNELVPYKKHHWRNETTDANHLVLCQQISKIGWRLVCSCRIDKNLSDKAGQCLQLVLKWKSNRHNNSLDSELHYNVLQHK